MIGETSNLDDEATLERVYDYLLDPKYMGGAREFFPHRNDIQTLRTDYNQLLNGTLCLPGIDTLCISEPGDHPIMSNNGEYPIVSDSNIVDLLREAIYKTRVVDKHSWSRQRMAMALYDLLTKEYAIQGEHRESRIQELNAGREYLISRLEAAGFTMIDPDNDGKATLRAKMKNSDGKEIPITLEVAPIKTMDSIRRKAGAKDKQLPEMDDLFRMRVTIHAEPGDDLDDMTMKVLAYMLKITGEGVHDSLKKKFKYMFSGKFSEDFLASKFFIAFGFGNNAGLTVIRSELQIATQYPDYNHRKFSERQLDKHRTKLGLRSYRDNLLTTLDYIYRRAVDPNNHLGDNTSFFRIATDFIYTLLNPEKSHFTGQMCAHEYLPEFVGHPKTREKLNKLIKLLKKYKIQFSENSLDTAYAIRNLNELIGLMERKYTHKTVHAIKSQRRELAHEIEEFRQNLTPPPPL